MLTRVHTVTTQGLEPIAIDVEVNTSTGIPQIVVIGLVNTAIREAKDRIVTALKNLGIRFKARRTIVSLVPANVKKSGSAFDFAIAVGLISLHRNLNISLEKSVFIGEVSLDGSLLAVSNCLINVLAAKKLGYKTVFIPFDNLKDVSLVEEIAICGVKNVLEIIEAQHELIFPSPTQPKHKRIAKKFTLQILGQTEVVRAITVAIAGKHHLHLVGPPGVGKSTLPEFAKELLPELNKNEALEVSSLHSLVGIEKNPAKIYQPPFIAPHHSATQQKILGYASQYKPGALSLAHRGVLFLDEFPEFSSKVLQALRIPLDKKKVQVIHQGKITEFPCNVILIAASNPCPCGFWQTGVKSCSCSAAQRAEYTRKLSGPLMDRFDLHIQVAQLTVSEYSSHQVNSSEELYEKVISVRKLQKERYQNSEFFNSDLKLETINRYCAIQKEAEEFIKKALLALKLSTRGYEKIIAVSQTLADLEHSSTIQVHHCAEALNYRFEHSSLTTK